MTLNGRDAVRASEAGRRLGVSRVTVRDWWEKGLLEGFLSKPGSYGRLWIYVDSIASFDAKRHAPGSPTKAFPSA